MFRFVRSSVPPWDSGMTAWLFLIQHLYYLQNYRQIWVQSRGRWSTGIKGQLVYLFERYAELNLPLALDRLQLEVPLYYPPTPSSYSFVFLMLRCLTRTGFPIDRPNDYPSFEGHGAPTDVWSSCQALSSLHWCGQRCSRGRHCKCSIACLEYPLTTSEPPSRPRESY